MGVAEAIEAVRRSLDAIAADGSTSGVREQACRDAVNRDLDYAAMRAALVSCFVEHGNHLRFEGAQLEPDIQFNRLFERDGDSVASEGLEPRKRIGDFIGARREGEQPVNTVGFGDGRRFADELGARGFHGDAGQRIPLFVGYGPENLARRNLGGYKCAEECRSDKA